MGDLRKNLIERRFIELSPELAKHYLEFNTFEVQRNIKTIHLNELTQKMKDGRFRFGEIAFADYPSKYPRDIMMNGQHVCYAVLKSDITVPCVLEKFKIDNERDMSELFRQFEIQPRSLKDMAKVEAHSLGLDWPIDFTSLMLAAAKIDSLKNLASMISGRGVTTKEQSIQLLSKYLKEGEWISSIMTSRSQAKHLWRAPVVYVMFNTFRKNQPDSMVFWKKARDGENLTKDMPVMKVREFLLRSYSARASSSVYQRATNKEFITRCIIGWNSFRTGKPTNLVYRPGKPIPKIK